jgi:glutathione peroxidase
MSIYDIKVKNIDGKETDLSAYRGKKMLIVNTASECGYTKQYKHMQELHLSHGDKIEILAFPSNDFGGQEPGSEVEIKNFCEKNYHITFPLFAKIHIVGERKHPLYQWLSDASKNGWNEREPTWNFCKYLVDEEGKLLNFFSASVDPSDHRIIG